jgi:hypothetical protein
MQYQIFVEDQSNQHFVASVIGMPNIEADGNTESEAISKAENALRIQLAKGKIVIVEVDTCLSANPFVHAGILQDDPTFDDWMERLGEIRKRANEANDNGIGSFINTHLSQPSNQLFSPLFSTFSSLLL